LHHRDQPLPRIFTSDYPLITLSSVGFSGRTDHLGAGAPDGVQLELPQQSVPIGEQGRVATSHEGRPGAGRADCARLAGAWRTLLESLGQSTRPANITSKARRHARR
jgi:hypothetical protein